MQQSRQSPRSRAAAEQVCGHQATPHRVDEVGKGTANQEHREKGDMDGDLSPTVREERRSRDQSEHEWNELVLVVIVTNEGETKLDQDHECENEIAGKEMPIAAEQDQKSDPCSNCDRPDHDLEGRAGFGVGDAVGNTVARYHLQRELEPVEESARPVE